MSADLSYHSDAAAPPVRQFRRWLQFSAGTMLFAMSAIALWLGWELKIVRDRKEALVRLKAGGGNAHVDPSLGIPLVRRWAGDEPIGTMAFPKNFGRRGHYKEDRAAIARHFPEVVRYVQYPNVMKVPHAELSWLFDGVPPEALEAQRNQ